MQERSIATNGIHIRLLDHGGSGPVLLLLPGLTANRRAFDGLVAEGLTQQFHVLSVDMRGRGESSKPESYSIADHAVDIVGVLDALDLERVILGGHSFGGLMTMYLATLIPDRISKVIIIDSAFSLGTERTRDLIAPALARLDATYPTWGDYIALIKQAPYFHGWEWDERVENYYRADVETLEDGTVRPRSRMEHISACMDAVIAEPWRDVAARITQPALLIHTPGAYGPPGAAPIVSQEQADETVAVLANGRYVRVGGNHMTMLYSAGAAEIVQAIVDFAAEG